MGDQVYVETFWPLVQPSHLKFAVPDPMDALLRNDQVVKVVWGTGEPRIAYPIRTLTMIIIADTQRIEAQWNIKMKRVLDLSTKSQSLMKWISLPSLADAIKLFAAYELPKDEQQSDWEFISAYTDEMINCELF